MKVTILAIAALIFGTSPFVRAQDVEASPSPSETTSSMDMTTTGATATPAAAKSPTATAEKSAAPAGGKKSASPAATKSAASPAAAMPQKKMSVEAALKDNENSWEAAVGNHDMATVESMVADDFAGVSSKGKVSNRRSLLSEMKKDKDTYTSAKNEKLDVHMYGTGVAVVVGTSREQGTDKDGKAFDRTFRFTDTWLDRNGKWQCIASQIGLVSQK
jgi:ketosteroid isomerase-like protein